MGRFIHLIVLVVHLKCFEVKHQTSADVNSYGIPSKKFNHLNSKKRLEIEKRKGREKENNIYSFLNDEYQYHDSNADYIIGNVRNAANTDQYSLAYQDIFKMKEKWHLDVGIVMHPRLINMLKNEKDALIYVTNILVEIKRTFSISNIQVKIAYLNLSSPCFPDGYGIFSHDENDCDFLGMNLDYYLFLGSLKLFKFDFKRFKSQFCFNNATVYDYFEINTHQTAKYTAEKILIYFLRNFIPTYKEIVCHCPYSLSDLCIDIKIEFFLEKKQFPTKILQECYLKILEENFNSICLYEKSNYKEVISNCGDGIVDENEECDCGIEFICKASGQDKCCNYNNCTFKEPNFQCSTGDCCINCQFANNTKCRDSYGECDISEYCNGKSSDCPRDFVVDHYNLCNNGKGFCINGMCTNLNSLCGYVFNANHINRTEDIFFDRKCYHSFEEICLEEAYKHMDICRFSMCSLFICAIKNTIPKTKQSTPFLLVFKRPNIEHNCIIFKKHVNVGIYSKAPNYLRCSESSDDFCYNSQCISDKAILKNCGDNKCHEFENSEIYKMTKIVPLNNLGQHFMKLGLYNYVKKKTEKIYKYHYRFDKTTFMLIGLLIIIILIICWTIKREKKLFPQRIVLSSETAFL